MAALRLSLAATLAVAVLSSCSTGRYYLQATKGQYEILARSEPLSAVIANPDTPPQIRAQLILAERLVQFAERELSLEAGTAYTAYADLERDHVIWNLFAAPELSLKPKQWRYPIVGALDYRGYFTEEAALASAQSLKASGFDVVVGGVDAYSTLGWFRDPLLNTFIEDNEILLAELIFHELTHRRVFRKSETAFNEALATAVSHEGVRRWLRAEGKSRQIVAYERMLRQRSEFYDHVEQARTELKALYLGPTSRDRKIAEKQRILAALQADFRAHHRRWKTRGAEHWLTQPLNNAHLVASATYHQHLPIFQALLTTHGDDFEGFFRVVKKLPPVE